MPEGFGMAALGALYSSVVIAIVIALLETELGRSLGRDLDSPVRGLVAVPVLLLAAIVFTASVLALVLPGSRRRCLSVAGIAGWLIPAWLVIAAVLIGSLAFAIDRLG